jgi:hypothetical protein
MAKLLLLSVVIMMITIPVLTARDQSAKHGLRKTIILMIVFNVLYLLAVRFIYPHLQ